MSDRLYTEEEIDAARKGESRAVFRAFLFAPPVLPAAFGSFFSESLDYSPYLDTGIFQDFEDLFGDVLTVYVIIAAYLVAIFAFLFTCAWPKGYWQILLLYWLAWCWFYVSVFVNDSLLLAFGGLLGASIGIFLLIDVPMIMWHVIRTRR